MKTLTRRSFLRTTVALASLPTAAMLPGVARAADFTFKCGHDLPTTHPVHLRLLEAAARIKKATNGGFDLQIFGDGQLGRAADMFTQVRTGGLEMALTPDVVVATLTPLAAINAVGFAFSTEQQAFAAMDGDLGAFARQHIVQSGLQVMDKMWENGFRQITSGVKPIVTPADLHGFKIRVPVSPLVVSMFKDLGAGPTALNFGEVYSSLQTKVVDGQENPLTTIFSAKFFEVQKYCSMTNHQWNGDWMLINAAIWSGVPKDVQQLVSREINQSAVDLRGDVAKLNVSLVDRLSKLGMAFNNTDPIPFRAALKKAGFYDEWRKTYGAQGWSILTKYASDLA